MKLKTENLFFDAMGTLGDYILLNIIFVITCIPVVTIGMAQAALYAELLKMAEGDYAHVVREYLALCKREWKKATKLWMIMLVIGAVLVFDVLYAGNVSHVIDICVGAMLFFWILIFSYVFPLISHFENTISGTVKNAFYMAVRHFPYTVVIVILNMIPVAFFLFAPGLFGLLVPIYMVVGFVLCTRINTVMFQKIFKQYE